MNKRLGVCCLLLLLACGSEAEAATFCVTNGNDLNLALVAAQVNEQDDTIKVATGTHITDYHAPGAYQWSYRPQAGPDHSEYAYSLTLSGGWNAADNCQTQSSLDPTQTVLDARYFGPVFTAEMNFGDFGGTLQISNLTFSRGENKSAVPAGIQVFSNYGTITVDNILVTAVRSGADSSSIASLVMSSSGTLKVRNSQFLNNSFTHPSSGGMRIAALNGAQGYFTNNSISGNTATIRQMGLMADGAVILSNNAVAGNTSTLVPSHDFTADSPAALGLYYNHFETVNMSGSPLIEAGTSTGNPGWTQVGSRMVPNAVSPLRDAGDNNPSGGVPNIDFSGQSRIVNVNIDRGAVEANAPAGVATGPVVTANSPANGSTTVLKGSIGAFVTTNITFNVSGGTAPGTTKVECSKTSGPAGFGIDSSGGTVGVGGSVPAILVGFTLVNAPQTGVVTCVITRDNASGSTLTYNFIGKATPTIATSATGSTVVGNAISDTATLTGGISPTGTVTFNVYGPNNPTCAGAPAFTVNGAVQANATATGAVSPALAGTYRWIASYAGDGNNSPVAGACNDANETSVVNKATPTLATQASASIVVGKSISDAATLANGFNPAGTITFRLYGPNDAACQRAPAFTSLPVQVNGNGNYGSGSFTPTAEGTYSWIASYSGDVNNNPAVDTCGLPQETQVIAPLIIPTLGPLGLLLLLIGVAAVGGVTVRRVR